MSFNFQCSYQWSDGEVDSWNGRVMDLKSYQSLYEFYIQSRSGILVLAGKYAHGYFACLPDFQAGCYLSSFNDLSYNREKLITAMNNPVDGATVAGALKALADILPL
jgi:hypothetical protein